MRKRLLNKNGITIAEAVIAMTVITIVTVSAISIILSSTVSTKKATYITEAQDFALSALECFRTSENEDDFKSALEFIGGYSGEITENADNYTLTLENSGYNVSIIAEYSDSGADRFSVSVTDGESAVTDTIEFTKASRGVRE